TQKVTLSSQDYSIDTKMSESFFIRKCFFGVKLQDLQETSTLIHELLHNLGISHPINTLNGEFINSTLSTISKISSSGQAHNKLTPFDQKILQHCFNGIIKKANDTLDINMDDSKNNNDNWVNFLNHYDAYGDNGNNVIKYMLYPILALVIGSTKSITKIRSGKKESLKMDFAEDMTHLVLSPLLPNLLNSIYMVEKIADEYLEKDHDRKDKLQRISAIATIICLHNFISNGLIDEHVIPISLLNIFFDDKSLMNGKFRVRFIDEVWKQIDCNKTQSDTRPEHSSQAESSDPFIQVNSQNETPPTRSSLRSSSSTSTEAEIHGTPIDPDLLKEGFSDPSRQIHSQNELSITVRHPSNWSLKSLSSASTEAKIHGTPIDPDLLQAEFSDSSRQADSQNKLSITAKSSRRLRSSSSTSTEAKIHGTPIDPDLLKEGFSDPSRQADSQNKLSITVHHPSNLSLRSLSSASTEAETYGETQTDLKEATPKTLTRQKKLFSEQPHSVQTKTSSALDTTSSSLKSSPSSFPSSSPSRSPSSLSLSPAFETKTVDKNLQDSNSIQSQNSVYGI
ncbi:MAG: hypothetical protein ACI9W5_000892, partial [Ulvibacter sp.]